MSVIVAANCNAKHEAFRLKFVERRFVKSSPQVLKFTISHLSRGLQSFHDGMTVKGPIVVVKGLNTRQS